jgi:hypothetical protein
MDATEIKRTSVIVEMGILVSIDLLIKTLKADSTIEANDIHTVKEKRRAAYRAVDNIDRSHRDTRQSNSSSSKW